jgi:outer membrane protein assembly factor BamD
MRRDNVLHEQRHNSMSMVPNAKQRKAGADGPRDRAGSHDRVRSSSVHRVALGGLLGLCLTVLLPACSTTPKDDIPTAASVDALYKEAKAEANTGGYDRAIKLYERLEGRAAGTLVAQQAQLELAYLYHRTKERAQALTTVERFIKLHPSSPAIDYAMYLRGVINFNEDKGLFGNFVNQDLSERDQQASRDAFQAFKQLVDQYPKSNYAPDARLRMDYIVNALSEYEVHVARYYYVRGAYLAAANRAQQALGEFPQAPANEEALYILMQSYDKMGLEPLRDDAKRVLTKNFPNSDFLSASGRASSRKWWHLW